MISFGRSFGGDDRSDMMVHRSDRSSRVTLSELLEKGTSNFM